MTKFDLLLFGALLWNIYQLVFKGTKTGQSQVVLVAAFIAHLFFDGVRWQIVPAYLMILAFFFLQRKTSKVTTASLVAGLVVSVLLPLLVPIISFPDPRGDYAVGSLIHHWVDGDRDEWFTPEDPNDKRQLMLQTWYPSIETNSEKLPFLDHLKIRAKTIAQAGKFPSFLAMHLEKIKTNSTLNSPVASNAAPFPIIIISHGITGMRQLHTSLAEKLASSGFAVFAMDHTYDANITVFPDGSIADYRSNIIGHPDSVSIRKRQIDTRVKDIQFVTSELERIQSGALRHTLNGYLDLSKIGIAGHSFGGSTATLAAFQDDRYKAVVALDSWINPLPKEVLNNGIIQPYLYMGRPTWIDSDYPSSISYSEKLHKNNRGSSYHVTVRNTRHLNFVDAPLFSPIGKYLVEIGDINRKRSVTLVNQLTFEFFNKYLRGQPSSILDGSETIPEFIFYQM